MKRIRTLNGPIPDLAAYRARARGNATWQGYRKSWSKAGAARYKKLIESLTDLQHGLCGYCEIDLREDDRQVEHVIPQSDPNRGKSGSLDAANMTACCLGGTKKSGGAEQYLPSVKKNISCGQAKGGKTLPDGLDPRALPALPSLTSVDFRGRIEADAAACASCGIAAGNVNAAIEMLGLNVERLRLAREKHWDALSNNWQEHYGDEEIMEEAARMALLPGKDGRLPKFFTTGRSYFAPLSESVLAELPQAWI